MSRIRLVELPRKEAPLATPRVMKLVDEQKNLLACRVCGTGHVALRGDDGNYVRGSWQCMHACEVPAGHETRAYNGRRSAWIEAGEMTHPPARRG